MKEVVQRFFGELHKVKLKSMGFAKDRFRYTRSRGQYIEGFWFQGCSHNTAIPNTPWVFFINVEVKFADIPEQGQPEWFKRAHAWDRIESILPDAPRIYYLDEGNYRGLMESIPALLNRASEALPPLLPRAHDRALKGKGSPLPVPDTWKDE